MNIDIVKINENHVMALPHNSSHDQPPLH